MIFIVIDVCIVGAGIAGLSAARELRKAGKDVVILEKSRGVGGRSATRRVEGNRVDHGAQYFTVRDKRLDEQVKKWLESSELTVWSHGFHSLNESGLRSPAAGHPRYVFPNGMSTFGKLLASSLNVRNECRVTSIKPFKDSWLAISENDYEVYARQVIINTPAEQARALVNFAVPELKKRLESVAMHPCFALILGFPKELAPKWKGIKVNIDSPLAWIAHDSSKRLNPDHTVLTLHSTASFAKAHFESDAATVKQQLLNALSTIDVNFANPLFSDMQRWKYALASESLTESFLNYQDSLFICGDWCGGRANVEAAYLSGIETATALLSSG